MIEDMTQQSNPFSTGSGGPNFETRIQAAFTVLMLTGRIPPCLPPWPIAKIKLQGTYAGFATDDFIVYTRDSSSQKEAKLLAQIKHEIGITEKDETFAKVIQAAWNDFNNPSIFSPGVDAIALITGPLGSTDITHVRPLLEWARHSEDEHEFLGKVNTKHFSSESKRAKLQAFRVNLTRANAGIEVTDKQLWGFLRSYYLLGYDLDTQSGNTLSLIQSLIALSSTGNPSALWSQVVDTVQTANQNAGTITHETLPIEIINSFRAREDLQWDTDLRKLRDHGEYILGGIRTSIGEVHVKRPDLLTRLLEVSETSKFVFISGGRGAGKSSLVREFSEYMSRRAPVFCLRTEDLDKPHLDNVFSSMGMGSSISDIEAGFALLPKRYLLIESLEKLLELQNSSAFTDLLQFLNKHGGWTVIASGRDYAYQQIVFNYLQPVGLDHSSLTVDDFDDYEIQSLHEQLDPLKTIAENPSLAPLLKTPFISDLAYRVAVAGAQFSGGDGEKEFRTAVWRDVIAKEQLRTGGMPLKRVQTFLDIAVARARQMVYGIPEVGFDSETLLKLEEDNLVRRDSSNGLVSPAHDVLEDWALERYIDDEYRKASGEVTRFLEAVGHEPAMTRAFRLWLYQKLRYGDNVNALINDILHNAQVKRYWQDETISAVLLSHNPHDFLVELREHLFENEAELLKRFCFILRISCKTPSHALMAQLSEKDKKGSYLFLLPYGNGWPALIRFLSVNAESLPISMTPHLAAVLDEWSYSIDLEGELPEGAREAGLLALHLLKPLKNIYRDDEGIRKKLLGVIFKTIPAIQNEFNELLEIDVIKASRRPRRPYYVEEEFCKMAFEGFYTAFLCKHVPDTVIKLALHEWLIDESEDDEGLPRRGASLDIDEFFGLHRYKYEFFPSSGAKGPFQPLLRFHPRKGLDFILRLLNITAEKYAHSNLDTPFRRRDSPAGHRVLSAAQIEIQLNDQTSVKQYCSGRLWTPYRGFSNAPYLLESALMALENWLISIAETPATTKLLEWLYDHILRNSNSVMPTAVLVSVATGFPEKLGKAALPLLREPRFYSLDMSRMVAESGGGLSFFVSGFNNDPLGEIYAEERRTAAMRPWRKEHLEILIVRLQFSELRDEALAVIDELRSKVSQDEKWRFRFHRIDSRGWKPVKDKENKRIHFEPQSLEPDLIKIQQESQEVTALNERFSRMMLWANSALKREKPEREYYSGWREAIRDAKDLSERLKEDTEGNLAEVFRGGLVKAAAALMRDYKAEFSEEDSSWCSEVIIRAVTSNADAGDMTARGDKIDLDGAAAAASVVPLLLDFTEDEEGRLAIKKVMATAITHASAGIRAGAASGIREHLWQRDPGFAERCIIGSIEYARLQIENSYGGRRGHFSFDDEEQDNQDEGGSWVNEHRESIVSGALSFETYNIDGVGFNSHSPWFLVTPCLMIPDGSTEPHHVALFTRMLKLFFEAEKSTRRHRSERIDNDIHIHHELRLGFTRRFAEYLIPLREAGSQLFVDQLLEGCDSAPEFIDHLLLNIAFLTERTQRKGLYWELWSHLSQKVQAIAIENAECDSRYREEGGSRKLIRGMLCADAPWQKADYENQEIALGKDHILEFVNGAGKNVDVFEALSSLMYHFPKIFFEPGIRILARHQMAVGGTRLLSGVNTAFYLEGSIQRFLHVDETGPLPRDMHQACFTLLDAIVETASSRAYYLREQLIHSRRIQ
jgi:hypothetical protein